MSTEALNDEAVVLTLGAAETGDGTAAFAF